MISINKVMSDIIKEAFENIDPEADKRLDEKLKNGSESFGLYDVSKCDCSLLVACENCGEEKGLYGDFWENKKKHDKLTQEEIEEDCRNIPN